MKKDEKAIIRVVIATGISSVVTQLLTIREFLSQFQGNEFVIALLLFNWLVLGGIGTFFARLVSKYLLKASVAALAWLSLLLASFSPLQIFAVRVLRDQFFIHGSSVGFYPTLFYTLLTIAPYALLLGFVLPYSLFVLRVERPDYSGARIYMADNIGDVLGGALFSFLFVYFLTPMQAVFGASLLLLVCTFFLFQSDNRFSPLQLISVSAVFAVLCLGVFLEMSSLTPAEGKLVYYKESRYGRITIHQDHEQMTLFASGAPMFSNQNISMAEETVHYPLSQLDTVRNILLISAEGGMMEEIALYGAETIDYVELDPEMTSVQFQFGLLKKIPGLHVLNQDGRAYLAKTDKMYDAILISLPEPDTFQVNRFFTSRFFELARARLAPEGVLSFSMEGFDNYLAEPQRRKLSSIYNTAEEYFKHILLLPGQRVFYLCSNEPLRSDIPGLLARKGIQTEYISGYFYGNLTRDRIEYVTGLIDRTISKNHDYAPLLMRIMFSQWFAKFSTSPTSFFAVLGVLWFVYFLRITREEFVLFSTGFMTMGSEILVIFAFQIFFGYIYFQIGLIITVFLAGLLPGAWAGDRYRVRGKSLLAWTDLILLVLLGLLACGLWAGGDRLPVVFYLTFGFAVSLACGFQFPVALYLRGGDNPAATRAFSADLIGAAFGTLVTSVVLIPYLGIFMTIFCLGLLKLTSVLVVVKS